MNAILDPCLRIAGAGLVLLAILHAPMARRLRWREEAARMSEFNAMVFRVHNFFICVVLVGMGLPCLIEPAVLLERSRAGAWGAWSLCVFWAARLYCQHCVYPSSAWRDRRLETVLHWWCTLVWTFLTALFGVCAARQVAWIG